MAENWYTADIAMEKLGLARSTFYTKVEKGEIQKRIPEGKQRGAEYLVIEDGKEEAAKTRKTEKKSEYIFRIAKLEDAQEMYELGEKAMRPSGGHGILPEKLIPFLETPNSEIGHVLVRDNRIVGYFTIVPLEHDLLMKRMREEIWTSQIKPDQLAQFLPGIPIDCFIWETITDPEQRGVGGELIKKMISFFQSLGKRGVDIDGIYATASSPNGISLSYKIGMHLMNIPSVIRPDNRPFELKVKENPNWLTIGYIRAFESYKSRQERLLSNALSRLDPSQENKPLPELGLSQNLVVDINKLTKTTEIETIFAKATQEEIPSCVELSRETFPELRQGIASIETRLAWIRKNPDIFYVVKNQDQVLGYTAILPMALEKIQKILQNKEFMKDVKPEEVEEFKPGKPLHIYIMTMVTKPDVSKIEKRSYGRRLVGGMIATIIALVNKGINIKTLYARSETEDGIRLLRNIGFTQIPSETEMLNFMLEMNKSGIEKLERYEQALVRRQTPKKP